jgi:hypothetical protein
MNRLVPARRAARNDPATGLRYARVVGSEGEKKKKELKYVNPVDRLKMDMNRQLAVSFDGIHCLYSLAYC